MAEKDDWLTFPTVDDQGRTVIVTGRTDVDKFRSRRKYCIRVEVTLPYTQVGTLGFPGDADAALLEDITISFEALLKGKNTAILTGIYTGAGERNWIFYTFSTDVFNSFLNRALASFPLLPLKIYAENDPGWAEYDEMRDATRME